MRRAIYMILAGSCLAAQCSDETENGPLSLEAHMKGRVNIVGEFGGNITDKKGFQVSLVNGEQVVGGGITDEEGKFELQATTGTYTVMITKPDYASMSYPGVAILGGEQPYQFSPTVLQRSTISFEQVSLVHDDQSGLILFARITHANPPTHTPAYGRRIIIFMGTDANVSKDNYYQYTVLYSSNIISGSFSTLPFQYDQVKFPSGATMYVRAYGLNYVDGGYSDLMATKPVFFSLSTKDSGVVSVQIP